MFTPLLTLPLVCRGYISPAERKLAKAPVLWCTISELQRECNLCGKRSKRSPCGIWASSEKITTAAGCFSRNETLQRTNNKERSPSLSSFYVWCVIIISISLTVSGWSEGYPPKIWKNTIRQMFNSNSWSQIIGFNIWIYYPLYLRDFYHFHIRKKIRIFTTEKNLL